MTDRFVVGDDLLEEGADYPTWGITDNKAREMFDDAAWTNRIEVYSEDSVLRDTLLNLLNRKTR